MKKFILFLSICCLGYSVTAQKKLLQEGTTVRVRLMETLSSATSHVGEQVNLEISEDILVDGKVLIARGSKAMGSVTQAAPAKMMGKKGMLDFSIDYAADVNGKNIRLRSTVKNVGQDKMGGVIAAAVIINPLLLLVKGKDVNVEKERIFPVYVDKDYEVIVK